MDHRLLAIDVLACLHRVHRSLLVPVVRRGDDHGIDVLPRQYLAVIARRKYVVAPHLFAVRQPSVIAVRDRNQLHSRDLDCPSRISLALNPRADQRNLNMVVGGYRLSRLTRRFCKHLQPGSSRCNTRGLQESSTIQTRHNKFDLFSRHKNGLSVSTKKLCHLGRAVQCDTNEEQRENTMTVMSTDASASINLNSMQSSTEA